MAIVSFSFTTEEFLSGKKTVTRRDWAEKHVIMWQNFWDTGRLVHDAWDKTPIAGGKAIGKFQLVERPYQERLADMPLEDLVAEGGMCSTLDEYYKFINKSPDDVVTVVRFKKL